MSVPLRAPAACTVTPLPPRRRVRPSHLGKPNLVWFDEATLTARSIDGDSEAFSELVRRHHADAYGLALRITGSGHDADDVVQDAFLAAWRRVGAFRGEASFGSWLYRIVVNRCANLARTRKPVASSVDVGQLRVAPIAPRSQYPEQQAEHNATLVALRAALQTLTVQQRACWVLRELHFLSYPEIAKVLNVSPTVVRGRLARARAELAEAMQAWV